MSDFQARHNLFAIVYSARAEKSLARLSRDKAMSVVGAVEHLATAPFAGKPMTGRWKGLYRVRVRRDLRVVYEVDALRHIVAIDDIYQRGDPAYGS